MRLEWNKAVDKEAARIADPFKLIFLPSTRYPRKPCRPTYKVQTVTRFDPAQLQALETPVTWPTALTTDADKKALSFAYFG